jgi:hypothetical protein
MDIYGGEGKNRRYERLFFCCRRDLGIVVAFFVKGLNRFVGF